VCGDCLATYESGEFVVSEEDGHEIYCRWCGDGGVLVHCDGCVCSFCDACIGRNLGGEESVRIAGLDTWTCFLCAPAALDGVRDKYRSLLAEGGGVGSGSPGGGGAKKRSWEGVGPSPSALEASSSASAVGGEGGPDAATAAAAAAAGAAPILTREAWVVTEDLSRGRERHLQLRCVNEVDLERPPPFVYVASNVESASVRGKHNASGGDPDFLACCDCADGCVDPEKCACLQLSGAPNKLASYAPLTGRLVEPRLAVRGPRAGACSFFLFCA